MTPSDPRNSSKNSGLQKPSSTVPSPASGLGVGCDGIRARDGYDLSIHSNPDARAWARFFLDAYERTEMTLTEDTMLGWFANAMCAAVDHAERTRAPNTSRATGNDGERDGAAGSGPSASAKKSASSSALAAPETPDRCDVCKSERPASELMLACRSGDACLAALGGEDALEPAPAPRDEGPRDDECIEDGCDDGQHVGRCPLAPKMDRLFAGYHADYLKRTPMTDPKTPPGPPSSPDRCKCGAVALWRNPSPHAYADDPLTKIRHTRTECRATEKEPGNG